MTSIITLIGLWAVFGFTHSFFAANACKLWAQRQMGARFVLYRPLYSLLSLLLLIAIIAYEWQLPSHWLWQPAWPLYAVGIAGAIAGLFIMGICILKYFFYLSGIDVFFPPEQRQPVHFEREGLHRYVRHPLYFGTLLTIWSFFVCLPDRSYFVTCCMITLYTWLGTVWEEQKLLKEFGDAYKAYQLAVPRWGIRLFPKKLSQ